MSIHDENRKPRGRAKSLVQRSAVRRMVEFDFDWAARIFEIEQ